MAYYQWEIVGWGREPHERIKSKPTDEELVGAKVLIIKYTNVTDANDVRHALIRHPTGFPQSFRGLTLHQYIEQAIDQQVDRYQMELVTDAP